MSFIETIKSFMLCACMPLYLGGKGGSSQANTSTATTTTTSTNMLDQSMMGGDNAVGLNGNSNIVDKSVVNNTAFTDNSDRSTKFTDKSDRSTNFFDASNRSTNFADNSNRSTNFSDSSVRDSNNQTIFTDNSNRSTTVNTTDFGSVSAALGGMGQLSSLAVGGYGDVIKGALAGLSTQSGNTLGAMDKAFSFAGAASAADAQKYADVIGFAKDTLKQTNEAFATAKDGGQSKVVGYAIAAVAVVGVAFALKGN